MHERRVSRLYEAGPCGSLGRRRASTAPIVRAVSCYETRRAGERESERECVRVREAEEMSERESEREKEAKENGREKTRRRGSRAASQAAVKQADSGPSLSVSRLFPFFLPSPSPPSLVAFLRARALPCRGPRCAAPCRAKSKPPMRLAEAPGSRSRLGASLLLTEISLLLLPHHPPSPSSSPLAPASRRE